MSKKTPIAAWSAAWLIAIAMTAGAQAGRTEAGAPVDVKTQQFTDRPIPRFRVDAAWPRIPDGLIFGQVPGLAVDGDDNVWILQRPNSLTFSDTGLAADPPTAVCCRPAPHVLKFAGDGTLLDSWGGPALAPQIDGTRQWPSNVHGLFVGDDGSVWIGGNGDGDHVVLKFTADGEFLMQYGRRGATGGNFDRTTLGGPADIAWDADADEVLIADGYINKRIVGFDGDGQFTRFWGAYGTSPDSETRAGAFDQSQASSNADGGADPTATSFGDIVHCVVRGPDERIYVCDRRNNRIQVFEDAGDDAVDLVANIALAPQTGGTRTASDIAFSPDARFMYVADMMNGQVWILDAKSYEELGAIGRNGRYPGQFTWLHSVQVDSEGNVYTSEVGTGRRVQKFVFDGLR